MNDFCIDSLREINYSIIFASCCVVYVVFNGLKFPV